MPSNSNTIILKNKLNSGSVNNSIKTDGGDNNTIVNEVDTKSKKIVLDLRNAKIKGSNNKFVNRISSPSGSKIKVIARGNPRAKLSVKVRKV